MTKNGVIQFYPISKKKKIKIFIQLSLPFFSFSITFVKHFQKKEQVVSCTAQTQGLNLYQQTY